jgi:hypothetical protein
MAGSLRRGLDQTTWRQLGFEFSPEEVDEVEGFFDRWFRVYNQPGTGPFRSQEALFASFDGVMRVFGGDVPRRKQRPIVSAHRAGYCIAIVERQAELRSQPDENLRQLFALMDEHDGAIDSGDGMADALQLGVRLSEVAGQVTLDNPEIGRDLPGFAYREAVFADLSQTLFAKLKVTSWPHKMDTEGGQLVMRFGHAVGVCEEALPVRHAPQR